MLGVDECGYVRVESVKVKEAEIIDSLGSVVTTVRPDRRSKITPAKPHGAAGIFSQFCETYGIMSDN